jgi:hypothetical protein
VYSYNKGLMTDLCCHCYRNGGWSMVNFLLHTIVIREPGVPVVTDLRQARNNAKRNY